MAYVPDGPTGFATDRDREHSTRMEPLRSSSTMVTVTLPAYIKSCPTFRGFSSLLRHSIQLFPHFSRLPTCVSASHPSQPSSSKLQLPIWPPMGSLEYFHPAAHVMAINPPPNQTLQPIPSVVRRHSPFCPPFCPRCLPTTLHTLPSTSRPRQAPVDSLLNGSIPSSPP